MKTKYSVKTKRGDEIILAHECDQCHGSGKFEHLDENDQEQLSVDCGDCDGLGFLTTENGAQIAAFLADLAKVRR